MSDARGPLPTRRDSTRSTSHPIEDSLGVGLLITDLNPLRLGYRRVDTHAWTRETTADYTPVAPYKLAEIGPRSGAQE